MENNYLINKTNEMARELQITGTQMLNGQAVKVIEGGFGEGQKCMLAKTIAEIHDIELKRINELINSNIDEFEFGIDILDVKNNKEFEVVSNDHEILTQNAINRAKNIYLLSEQGYMLLVGFMKTDKAKEIRKQLRREYFQMRETLKCQRLEDLPSYEIQDPLERAIRWMEEYQEKEAFKQTAIVQQEQLREMKPKADHYDEMMDKRTLWKVGAIAQDFGISAVQLNKILATLKIQYKQGGQWLLYAGYKNKGLAVSRIGHEHTDGKVDLMTYWTEKGREFIAIKLAEIGYYPVLTKNNQMAMEV
ncbi:MAG: phage antirepressor KilAC domain-containing protein [Sarcina sp.]